MNRYFFVLVALLGLSGCSTISGWFSEEEELEIRQLVPLQNQINPLIVWNVDVGDGVDSYFSNLRPVVAYDKIFAADRSGVIYALDPQTGDRIWRQDISVRGTDRRLFNLYGLFPDRIPAKISGGLTAGNGSIFLGTENGDVIALDAASGELKWQTAVAGEVIAPPAIDSGIVVVNTVSGVLVGLDVASGEILWQNESDVPALSLRGISAPAAANGGAIVGTASGKLVVSIIDSGLTAWEQLIAKPTGATELQRIVDIDSRPLVFLGNVYVVSYTGALAAVELRTGQVIWNREYSSYRDLSIDGNRLFVSDISSHLYAVDRRNGVELWSNSDLRKRELTGLTPVGDYVVAGDKWGYLHFFSQEDGRYLARIEIGDDDEDEGIFTAPVEFDGKVLVQRRDGELFVVEIAK